MAFFKSIFGKKKEDDDGQAEYFREDFDPVVNKPAKKKTESKATDNEKVTKSERKPTAKKSEEKVEKKEEKPAPKAEKQNKDKQSSATKKSTTKATENKQGETKKASQKSTKSVAENKASTKGTATPKKSAKVKELTDDSPEVKGATSVSESKTTANGKWEIRRAKDGRYFFALYASNHTVIAYSQIYSSLSAVMTGINSVIANAPKCELEDNTLKKPVSLPCPKWEIYLDKAGEYRFRLYAPNGLVICHASHGYASKSGCKGGIESIKKFSVEAKVKKSY